MSKGLLALVKAAFKIAFGCLQSCYYFLRYQPSYIVAFGGYATFPILIAAIIFRTKIILHEQNAHLGKVNRFFARFAHKIALTFEKTSGIDEKYRQKLILTGNPVREEIAALNSENYEIPTLDEPVKRDKMGYDVILASEIEDFINSSHPDKTFNILVIGGSGGAKIFSDVLPRAFFNLGEGFKNHIHISQQCRPDLAAYTFTQYEKFNINITVAAFFENMAKQIKDAHLVIARSGSSSIVEFCAAKKPMILIPFAKAADDHQTKNAQIVEDAGAAIVLPEEEFTINKTSEILKNLIGNRKILEKMSQNAAKLARLDAASNLVSLLKND